MTARRSCATSSRELDAVVETICQRLDALAGAVLPDALPDRMQPLDRLLQAARITVDWEPQGAWDRSRHGSALLTASRSGFCIRIPRQNSLQWKRFVQAHEIGHTFFYDAHALPLSPSTRSAPICSVEVPLRRDLWVNEDLEEEICDEVADVLLMPKRVVGQLVLAGAPRLVQVERLARQCCVPVDRALRRWIAFLRSDMGLEAPDHCVQIAVWKVQAGRPNLAPGEPLALIYGEGLAGLRKGKYAAEQAGVAGATLAVGELKSEFHKDRSVDLPGLRGKFDVEILALDSNVRYALVLAAYDRTDGRSGYFGSARIIPR